MKRLLSIILLITSIASAGEFEHALKNGSVSGSLTMYHYDIEKQGTSSDAYATAFGGDLKYTTNGSKNFFATVGFHNSTPIFKDKNKVSTSLFNNDNDANELSTISESFLGYKTKNSVLKIH